MRKVNQADTASSNIPAFTALSLQGSYLGANRGQKSCDRKAKHKGSPSGRAKAAYRKNLNRIRREWPSFPFYREEGQATEDKALLSYVKGWSFCWVCAKTSLYCVRATLDHAAVPLSRPPRPRWGQPVVHNICFRWQHSKWLPGRVSLWEGLLKSLNGKLN